MSRLYLKLHMLQEVMREDANSLQFQIQVPRVMDLSYKHVDWDPKKWTKRTQRGYGFQVLKLCMWTSGYRIFIPK